MPEEAEDGGQDDGGVQAPVGAPGDHRVERAGSSQAVFGEEDEEPPLGVSASSPEAMEGEAHAASNEGQQQQPPSSQEYREFRDVLNGISSDIRDLRQQLGYDMRRQEALLQQMVEQNRMMLGLLAEYVMRSGPAPAHSTSSSDSSLT
ncbi:uncharacterized protein WCC33_012022 [Rhinophrynus dorsalis]